MRKKLVTKNFENGAEMSLHFEPVKKCPLCHTSFNGEVMSSAIAPFETSQFGKKYRSLGLYVLHYCQACSLGFLGVYTADDRSSDLYNLSLVVPEKHEPVSFSPEIVEVSHSFADIYQEAYAAEKAGLTQICGMGYRKSLEFLVKDYLIEKHPQESDAIAKEPLAQSIRRIDNLQIKTLAERSAWLGNDETHYIRKHDGYSYEDIKTFLEAMTAFILYERTVEKAFHIPRK